MAPACETATAIAQSLIRCPSVTPADAGALDVIERLLRPAGFAVHRVPLGGEGRPTIDNLYARLGTGAPHLLFAGHTDVVPPGAEAAWRHPPFAGEIEDGVLHGRGAQDMKGGIAAFLAAVLAHLAAYGAPAGSIGLLVTGDEEGPAIDGTVRLLEWADAGGERFDACVVGEPTSAAALGDQIKVGRRGSLNARLTATGRQGHVAYPARAANPLPALMRALDALSQPLDRGTEHFEASNLEITGIDTANPATNVIPGTATAAFNVRFSDLWDAERLEAELRRRVAGVEAGEVVLRLDVAPCNAPSFRTPASPFTELVVAAVADVTGQRPALSTGGGTSDARFIQRYGPVVELGLVGDTMHMVDERVPVADLEALSLIYRRLIERFFAG